MKICTFGCLQPEFAYGGEVVEGVSQATIERNTYPHKYKRVCIGRMCFVSDCYLQVVWK